MTLLAWVGIGANLGDPVTAVHEALAELAKLPHCRLVQHSSLYSSSPLGPGAEGQPDYINAVAALETKLAPLDLLAALFGIEQHFGRQRSVRNAARTLDLDLLLYGDQRVNVPGLHVPHPRMCERAFVLVPLAEIAPQTLIPGHGMAAELVSALADQGIRRLPD